MLWVGICNLYNIYKDYSNDCIRADYVAWQQPQFASQKDTLGFIIFYSLVILSKQKLLYDMERKAQAAMKNVHVAIIGAVR